MKLVTADQMEHAIAESVRAFSSSRKLSRFIRSRLLALIAKKIDENRANFVDLMIKEAFKPRTLADIEVSRAIQTFTWAS